MISREPTLERLAVANSLLLAPYDLTEAHLKRALGDILSHGADDADLYFQYTRSEGWSLEESIVKSGSFSIDQGVGVRAVSGEKTAFAYSDDLSWAALSDAAQTVRTIGAHGQTVRHQHQRTSHQHCRQERPEQDQNRQLKMRLKKPISREPERWLPPDQNCLLKSQHLQRLKLRHTGWRPNMPMVGIHILPRQRRYSIGLRVS